MIAEGAIEKGHAKILAGLDANAALQKAKEIIEKSLSVKDLSSGTSKKTTKKTTKTKNQDVKILEQDMSEALDIALTLQRPQNLKEL